MRSRCLGFFAIVMVAWACSPLALAQWSPDPLVNLAVAARPDSQEQPKVAPAPDGGWYVSWYDNDPAGSPAFGYDVVLQRLDASGLAQWGSLGVLIADRGVSWTMDHDLAVDAQGNAILAFNDDRTGSDQITVTVVDPSGVQLWGPDGVRVSKRRTDKGPPHLAVTSDGRIAVAWSESAAVKVKMLRPDGRGAWEQTITPPRGQFYTASDLIAADDGGVIVSWIREGTLTDMRHLLASRLSASGKPMWGSNGVTVFDGGALQMGHFPETIPDGAGGAVFAWYTYLPGNECLAQRILADGTEAFAHNGHAVSVDPNNVRTAPSAEYDAASGEVIVFCEESSMGQKRVLGQRFDAAGRRLWGDTGLVVSDYSPAGIGLICTAQDGSDTVVSWWEQLGWGDERMTGARVAASGSLVCVPFPVSSYSSSKAFPAAEANSAGVSVIAWKDGRADVGDVYAQNVNRDCTLGNPQR